MRYQEMYQELVRAAYRGKLEEVIDHFRLSGELDEERLEYILHPESLPPVIPLTQCSGQECEDSSCEVACLFSAIERDQGGRVVVNPEACVGCGVCLESCQSGNLVDRKDFIPLFNMLAERRDPVYAIIAPAFVGQFSAEVTPGQMRSAFKALGFYGMVEVALFADILTLKEALEFERAIQDDQAFLLTSCCCPMWVGMIRKVYNSLIPHMPPSVSPMIACGRAIKKLHPEAKTVFVGPCIAKKAEAKENDIQDAVDYVLTFEEVAQIFEAAQITLSELEDDVREHASTAGRIYGRTGGVSQAVADTLQRIRPDHPIQFKAQQADGMKACKELLKEIQNGHIEANFLEGMGCTGGCVGGPKTILRVADGTVFVNNYGGEAAFPTPADNPYVLQLLDRLGYESFESLLDADASMFIRHF